MLRNLPGIVLAFAAGVLSWFSWVMTTACVVGGVIKLVFHPSFLATVSWGQLLGYPLMGWAAVVLLWGLSIVALVLAN